MVDTTWSVAAKPSPFLCTAGSTALLIIDMQRDFLEEGGFGSALGNDVAHLRSCISPISSLLSAFRRLSWPVIHTQEGHQADLSDCPAIKRAKPGTLGIGGQGPLGRILIRGEPGHAIIPELAPIAGELVIHKPGKGAFFATDLDQHLRQAGIHSLIICGVTTDVCVQTTMREANDRGYACCLVEEATASYEPRYKAAVLDMVSAQGGIIGRVTSLAAVTAVLDVVAHRAPHPEACLQALAAQWTGYQPDCWRTLRPGVRICPLAWQPSGNILAAFLHYQPGASVPEHEHLGMEEIYVRHGSQCDGERTYGAGSVIRNPAGSRHRISSANGCEVLLVWEIALLSYHALAPA